MHLMYNITELKKAGLFFGAAYILDCCRAVSAELFSVTVLGNPALTYRYVAQHPTRDRGATCHITTSSSSSSSGQLQSITSFIIYQWRYDQHGQLTSDPAGLDAATGQRVPPVDVKR